MSCVGQERSPAAPMNLTPRPPAEAPEGRAGRRRAGAAHGHLPSGHGMPEEKKNSTSRMDATVKGCQGYSRIVCFPLLPLLKWRSISLNPLVLFYHLPTASLTLAAQVCHLCPSLPARATASGRTWEAAAAASPRALRRRATAAGPAAVHVGWHPRRRGNRRCPRLGKHFGAFLTCFFLCCFFFGVVVAIARSTAAIFQLAGIKQSVWNISKYTTVSVLTQHVYRTIITYVYICTITYAMIVMYIYILYIHGIYTWLT